MQAEAGDTSLLQAVVSSWIEAFNAHDVAAIVALYTEDAELFDAGMKQPRRGHAQIERWFTRRFSSMPAITYTPTDQLFTAEKAGSSPAPTSRDVGARVAEGGVVGPGGRPDLAVAQTAVLWTVRGRSPRLLGQAWLSRPLKQNGVSVFTLRDGRIAKQRGYYDHLSALEQILPPLRWLPWRL